MMSCCEVDQSPLSLTISCLLLGTEGLSRDVDITHQLFTTHYIANPLSMLGQGSVV